MPRITSFCIIHHRKVNPSLLAECCLQHVPYSKFTVVQSLLAFRSSGHEMRHYQVNSSQGGYCNRYVATDPILGLMCSIIAKAKIVIGAS